MISESTLVTINCYRVTFLISIYIGCVTFFLDFKVSRYIEGYRFGVFEDLKFKISEGLDQN